MNQLSILLDAAPQGDGGMSGILMIVLLIVIFYFFMIRPQQKRQKQIKNFRSGLQKGDKIITAGGIHGKICEINANDNSAIVEVTSGVKITVDLGSIYPSAADAAQSQQK